MNIEEIILNVGGGNGDPYILTDQDGNIISLPLQIIPAGEDTTIIITLTASDNCSTPVSSDINVYISINPPNNITANVIEGCEPLTVNFAETSPNVGQTYYWDFSDGFSIAKNPVHTFINDGIYIVSLNVTSLHGCTNTVAFEDTIIVNAGPAAGFYAYPNEVSTLDTVDFLDLSFGSSTWHWDFGDSDSSLIQNPVHVYTNAGIYQVEQIVTSENGCTDTTSMSVIVNAQNSFILSVTTIAASCGHATGSATITASGGLPPYSYQWSNGDILATADSLLSGIYTVTVTDSNATSTFSIATINDIGGATLTIVNITDVACFGNSTGAIDINVSGGNSPYTYTWSNGVTAQDISNISAGTYEVVVTDNTGCKTVQSITVTEPAQIVVFASIQDATCNNSDGIALVSATGGTSPYSYLWSTGQTSAYVQSLAAGTYTCTITDAHSCQATTSPIVVSNTGGPQISVSSTINTTCNGSAGAVHISVLGGTVPYSFQWSNGSTNQNITSIASGIYTVTVTDALGCKGVESAPVAEIAPEIQPICLVTVDSALGRNLVAWEKVQASGIDHYNIYKESTQANHYYLIGSVHGDSLSQFIDPVSNPMTRSWRYKISAVDLCGNKSPVSDPHKTIHLTMNQDLNYAVNLTWDNYEGFTFWTYNVWRHKQSTGWVLIDSVQNNVYTYTDNPPSTGGFYMIEAVPPTGCTADAKAVSHNSSMSNMVHATLETVPDSPVAEQNLLIFPNPFNDKTTVLFSNPGKEPCALTLTDVTGKVVRTYKNIYGGKVEIEKGNLSDGFYFVEIQGSIIYRGKLVVK